MKEHEAHQLLEELAHDRVFRAKAELDSSHVRPDGSGYGITVTWQGRMATVNSRDEWLSIKEAWQSQDEGVAEQPGPGRRRRRGPARQE